MFKNLALLPVVLSVLAGLYGGVSYINKLTNVINTNEREVSVLNERLNNLGGDFDEQSSTVSKSLSEGREELIREVTEIVTRVAQIEATMYQMKENAYTYATNAEVRAVSDNYYKLRDDINTFKYDLQELDRKLQGGY
tara:strand:- start:308 stop:721 length:414 start_codon:yes stop_codon:yes gene_type:complete